MRVVQRTWASAVLIFAFSRDLVVSSVQVARAVLGPRSAVQPRFVVVPLTLARSDLEITLVSNYITLTPGTLTVDVSPDRSKLLVHALQASDGGDGIRADVADCIEARVTRVTR